MKPSFWTELAPSLEIISPLIISTLPPTLLLITTPLPLLFSTITLLSNNFPVPLYAFMIPVDLILATDHPY